MQYCNNLFEYSRFRTRVVMVGNLGIGGDNPIRVQSMTTTDTMDTAATVAQSIRMIEAGCELVRITAPSLKEAQNLQVIKDELRSRGYNTPLVADIHFTPNAAELAAKIVEKVRVNPGNYADKKKFEHIDFSDSAYEAELERIRKRFIPLVKICKEHGTAMRIGTNHGSLSDRILSRYGDTPEGMVESAMEFVRICEAEGYHEIILSMKASNPQVMIQAYRLLVARMIESGQNYPLHLGVTEAGEGEDGRIKSAAGIGTLLEDGLGDTIRVSLTEEPEFEIPVAQILVNRYPQKIEEPTGTTNITDLPYDPCKYQKRESDEVLTVGGKNVPRVIVSFEDRKITPSTLFQTGYNYSVPLDKWNIADNAADFIYTGNMVPDFKLPGTLGVILNHTTWKQNQEDNFYPLINIQDFNESTQLHPELNFILAEDKSLADFPKHLAECKNAVLIISSTGNHPMSLLRKVFIDLGNSNIQIPVVMKLAYNTSDIAEFQMHAGTDAGGLFLDGFGDGLWLNAELPQKEINNTTFNILQATRTRISKTEYISCPSCGRTLFDLQETTAKIRARTSHLKGVKIGIMGCIVNGPGEMADADYGYVGTGPGKITLYKGQKVVKKNIPSESAVDELIELIQENGDWQEVINM